jgi:hypothetical protein
MYSQTIESTPIAVILSTRLDSFVQDIPERLPNDFLLSFRRGYAAWHFTAPSGCHGAVKVLRNTWGFTLW